MAGATSARAKRSQGPEALSFREKLVLLTSKSIREDYLYQDSFDPVDAYISPKKQYEMMKTILSLFNEGMKLSEIEEFDFKKLEGLEVLPKVAKCKDIPEENMADFGALRDEVATEMAALK